MQNFNKHLTFHHSKVNQATTAALLTRLQSSFFITCDHGVAGNKELSSASQRGILLRMFCKLVLIRETTGMRLRRFPAQEKQEDTSENNNGYCIWDNLSYHFSLCNLNGSEKVLKLLCGVWKEVTFKNDYQNKKGQCRVNKSKTTLVLERRTLHRRAY